MLTSKQSSPVDVLLFYLWSPGGRVDHVGVGERVPEVVEALVPVLDDEVSALVGLFVGVLARRIEEMLPEVLAPFDLADGDAAAVIEAQRPLFAHKLLPRCL